MIKSRKILLLSVLISSGLFCKNTFAYLDNYPPYSFKKGPPAHLEAKLLVDFDKSRYKSRDGKIIARLKEKADSFDFLLKTGKLVLARLKDDTPPLPNSVYQADLSGKGLRDFIIFYNYRGSGFESQKDKVEIFLKKKQGGYRKISYNTLSAGLEDFVDLDNDGKYEIIITDYYAKDKHNYFTYNIYRIADEKLVNADDQFKGFPKFVWITYRKNDKDTIHLTPEERATQAGKKNDSIQYAEVSEE